MWSSSAELNRITEWLPVASNTGTDAEIIRHSSGYLNTDEQLITKISNHPYEEGNWVCNLFKPSECFPVKDGKLDVSLVNKEVKILLPKVQEDSKSKGVKIMEGIQDILNIATVHQASA